MPARSRGPKTAMTAEHKAALATGRNERRVVKGYLDALESSRPRRGRTRTPETIEDRLGQIDAELAEAEPVARLHLYQEELDLRAELGAMGTKVDLAGLEDEFVSVASSYSARRGISYAAWREAGVSPAVLRRAGL